MKSQTAFLPQLHSSTMTSTTGPQQQQQKSLLLDVMTVYLEPLLKKHEDGKLITWEDLTSSNTAAQRLLDGRQRDIQQQQLQQPTDSTAGVVVKMVSVSFNNKTE